MLYKGNPASGGIGIGEVYCFEPEKVRPPQGSIVQAQVAGCLEKYEAVKGRADAELGSLIDGLQRREPDKAKIFMAHREILHDESIDGEIRNGIAKNLLSPEWAIYSTYAKYGRMLAKSKGEFIRERTQDILDVRNRLLLAWQGKQARGLDALEKPVIIACRELLPSDTATLDRSKVIAILTETGGVTSHSAIIARSYGIPAVLGISGLMNKVSHGELLIVDAVNGELITEPTLEQVTEYEQRRDKFRQCIAEVREYRDKEPLTRDGVRVDIGLNIGSAADSGLMDGTDADFVGLFRTEFLYMVSDRLPTEEEQYVAYKKVLTAFKGRSVTLRTLDIGGDKTLPCLPLPREENPFLGRRALRLCFESPDIFRTQLRAALRASLHGNLRLMLPMVSSMDDIRRAKDFIAEVGQGLENEGIAVGESVKIGIMVEVPSIALLADMAATEVDFASIGTNDLCQYLMAVDRMNPCLAPYYQSFNPAMFRLIGYIADQFHAAGKPVGVCGELGGDPLALPVLVGLGIRKLSMGASAIAGAKKTLSRITIEFARDLAKKVQSFSTADEVIHCLKRELVEYI
jgi:phosphotransferase system enzyme I (PtsI)